MGKWYYHEVSYSTVYHSRLPAWPAAATCIQRFGQLRSSNLLMRNYKAATTMLTTTMLTRSRVPMIASSLARRLRLDRHAEFWLCELYCTGSHGDLHSLAARRSSD